MCRYTRNAASQAVRKTLLNLTVTSSPACVQRGQRGDYTWPKSGVENEGFPSTPGTVWFTLTTGRRVVTVHSARSSCLVRAYVYFPGSSLGMILSPGEHLAVSEDICGCYNCRRGGKGCSWHRVGRGQAWCRTSYSTQAEPSTAKTYLAPSAKTAVAEKLMSPVSSCPRLPGRSDGLHPDAENPEGVISTLRAFPEGISPCVPGPRS